MSTPTHAPRAREVFVDSDGTVRGAVRARASLPAGLAQYAPSFLATRHTSLQFLFREKDSWLRVRFQRHAGGETHRDSARVRWGPAVLPDGLTAREVDVLTLVSFGLTNQQIAQRLGTSARTVSTQIERLLGKLAQGGRAGLAAICVEQSLLRLPVPGGVGAETGLAVLDVERAHVQRAGATPLRRSSRPVRRAPIHIGSVLPLTGPAWADGLEAHRGAQLAVAQINARGGIDGRPLEHVVASADFFDPVGVVAAFRSLADLEVDAIITSYANAECPEVLDVVADFGQIFLHNATFEEQVALVRAEPERFGMIFQTCPSEIHYGAGFVRLLDDLVASRRWHPRSRRLVAVELDSMSTHTANERFLVAAERSGWSVADVIQIPMQQPDWQAIVRSVCGHDPAAVMVTHFVSQAMAQFQRAFHTTDSDALVYGVYGPSIPHFADEAREAAEGMLWSTVTGTYDDEFGQAFRRDFQRLHGTPAGWSQASAAYDQVKLLSAAWATTGSVSTPDVAGYLRSTVYRGVNGVYYLGGQGQSALAYPDVTPDPSLGQAHMVFQVQEGASRLLGPAPYGRVEAFRTPPWVARGTA
jgi:branched-chain amino acid transport system substrate-binding protein